ncbi:hypothetical protein DB347_16035 [Opitutaceae bacterium EW11]|nr:hypothetical protein DB347_16035 [Opitutaceae bacterium EW11]
MTHRSSAAALAVLLASAPLVPLFAQNAAKDLITPPQLAQPQSTQIRSDQMEMWSTDTETMGVFSGNVVVTGTNLKITCDKLEITATRIGDKAATVPTLEKFKFLLATGKVHIVQGDREASCGRAEVYPRENRIVMKEDPMAVDHGSEVTWVGDEIEMLRGERRVRGKNIQLLGPAIKDLGFDKNTPAPKAEPEKPVAAPATPNAQPAPVSPALPPAK